MYEELIKQQQKDIQVVEGQLRMLHEKTEEARAIYYQLVGGMSVLQQLSKINKNGATVDGGATGDNLPTADPS